jgi:molybdopterin converting factor small subunit
MVLVAVELPGLVASLVGIRALELEADSLADAFARLRREHPRLSVHFFDEVGALRQHVLCFHNGANTRWSIEGDVPLRGGDRITFLQAVTGG